MYLLVLAGRQEESCSWGPVLEGLDEDLLGLAQLAWHASVGDGYQWGRIRWLSF